MAQQASQGAPNLNILVQIAYNIWLVWRLFWEKRVSIVLKALPLASLIYLVSPDISAIPCIGALTFQFLDDAVVLYVLNRFFVSWAPAKVVGEHQLALDAQFTRLLGVEAMPDEEEDESEDGASGGAPDSID